MLFTECISSFCFVLETYHLPTVLAALFDDDWFPAEGFTDSQLTGPLTGTEVTALAYAAPPAKKTDNKLKHVYCLIA